MEDNCEWQQAMEEREQMVEEAFQRAREGTASENDWQLLQYELGIRKDRKCY